MERDIDELLSVEQVSRLLGLKKSTIRRYTKLGLLPHCRPTGKRAVRYSRRMLESLIEMRTTPMKG